MSASTTFWEGFLISVLVDRAQDGDDLLLGRERDRPGAFRAVALRDVDDLRRSLVRERVLVASDLHSDLFLYCHVCLLGANYVMFA